MQQQQTVSASSPFSAYADRPQMGLDVEFGSDPASGAFFQTDYKKHDDLKQMLDSNKDGLKLEAMKRIIGMIARGRDASVLFPAVVKNVVSKNIEVKKLVYVYLVRYAEDQQDLALLSISTFQRALKDPNQLIRASALRVLSSIRVSMIVPIVMLAIRESASDMSPYVRKTAAHAIPKLYSLDAEQKDELVTVIEKLLSDRTTLVVGSAVMAFDEVCPERVDLIHKNYRKLCSLLVDVDEWGQVVIINMLTRYARTQFVNPNGDGRREESADGNARNFYDEENSTSRDSSDEQRLTVKKSSKKKSSKHHPSTSTYVDLDHRLLLRQTKPLLQSRNASVVMAVAQLYHHVAPRQEVQLIAKALIRLLRSHKEVQSVVLTCIASMSALRKSIFEPYMKSFFVRTSDPTHIKLVKLDILTNLATAASISVLLREFQTYISSSDRSFVAATIQAIGRCAASIKEVTETCLGGLVHLLSNRDEHVVAESVVVIKKLLQTNAAEHFAIISQMAKILDFITVPAARASIIWLVGEYNEKVPKIAPDVLRKMAKTFVDEDDNVKLQILNLSIKLYLTNAQQISLLCQYVFTLARYDPNYDIRDRARFLRQFIFPANGSDTVLSKEASRIFLAPKPAPILESKYRDRDYFQLGSLSHYLNQRATGYNDLPDFPTTAPDPTVRNIEGFAAEDSTAGDGSNSASNTQQSSNTGKMQKNATAKHDKNFYSESEKSSEYTNSEGSTTTNSSSEASDNSSAESSEEDDEDESKVGEKELINHSVTKTGNKQTTVKADTNANNVNDSGTEDSESSSSSESSDSESESVPTEPSNSDSEPSSNFSSHNSNSNNNSTGNTKNHKRNLHEKQQKVVSLTSKHSNKSDTTKETEVQKTPAKSNLDLLLDLDDIPPVGPVMTPSLGGFLTPGTPFMTGAHGKSILPSTVTNRIEIVGPSYIDFNYKELLNKLSGYGLQLNYRFSRTPHLYSSAMVSIQLQFNNYFNDDILNIHMDRWTLPSGMSLNSFAAIASLQPLQKTTSVLGVDFNDSTHAIEFDLVSSIGISRISLKPPVGELVRSVQISIDYFKEERTKLRGMNEHQSRLTLKKPHSEQFKHLLKQKVFECINVANIPTESNSSSSTSTATSDVLYFVGQTMSSKSLVLITLEWDHEENPGEEQLLLTVNCEKMVVGSMVLNELRNTFQAAF